MLAIGVSPGRLRRLILAEGLVLGAIAALLGSLLGSLLTWYLVAHGIDLRSFYPESIEFGGVIFDPILRATWDLAWMARIALYLVALAMAAAVYPAVKAARLAPAAAMRHY
jgi:ABC-type lipoprotein release transport system permease subunit